MTYLLFISYPYAKLHYPKEGRNGDMMRYRVLREMAEIVDKRRESHNKETRSPWKRIFVKEVE